MEDLNRKSYSLSKWILLLTTLTFFITAIGTIMSPAETKGFISSAPYRLGLRDTCTVNPDNVAVYQEAQNRKTDPGTIPDNLYIVTTRSSDWPGYVDVTVYWHSRENSSTDLLMISGAYGKRTAYDFLLPDGDMEFPKEGECVDWYKWSSNPEGDNNVRSSTIKGLWGEHTYCFTVSSNPDYQVMMKEPNSFATPICVELHWQNYWGSMALAPLVIEEESPSGN